MELKEVKTFISNMDTRSKDYFDLYCMVSDKYWTFPPEALTQDQGLRCRWILNQLANIGNEPEDDIMPILTVEIANNVCAIVKENLKALHGAVEFEKQTIYFDIYTDRTALASMATHLKNTIMVNAEKDRVNLKGPIDPEGTH